jgi:hypothetical protein
MASDAQDRSEIARLGGLARVASAPSGSAMTAPARRAFRDSFYRNTDPALPDAERQRQAEAAYKAHMLQLSRKAKAARARKSAARKLLDVAEILQNEATSLLAEDG